MKARLIASVSDLLLDWILLLVRDDTPATTAPTFQELAQLLSSNIHHSDRTYEIAVWVQPESADGSSFDTQPCFIQAHAHLYQSCAQELQAGINEDDERWLH
jgi:hypothetical protein